MDPIYLLPIAILRAFIGLRYRNFVTGVEADPTADQVRRLPFFIETAVMVIVTVGWLAWALGS